MFFLAGKNGKLIPGWFWIIFVLFPLGLVAWWFFRWFFLPSYQRTAAVEIQPPRSEGVKPAVKQDDFKKLKGIGPKTASALLNSGIYTFEQLALLEPEKIKQILVKNSLPARGIDFWQQQAALAAAGDWDDLEKLQN